MNSAIASTAETARIPTDQVTAHSGHRVDRSHEPDAHGPEQAAEFMFDLRMILDGFESLSKQGYSLTEE